MHVSPLWKNFIIFISNHAEWKALFLNSTMQTIIVTNSVETETAALKKVVFNIMACSFAAVCLLPKVLTLNS